jgi:signal transduction histidine kinase
MKARSHNIRISILGLVFGWTAFFMADNGLAAGSVSIPLERVVDQYALTSANDFPERDPQDWRLLGSDDGGKTWVALDIRKGEMFPGRHQRRVFAFTNARAFSLFRLQIDRVRSPESANAVQLSEVEPGSDAPGAPDLTPIFCDVISAQGENPPAETVYQAFDGREDTKWLDKSLEHPQSRSSFIQWGYLDHSGLVLTNLFQLRSLRARAADGYEIRVVGTLAGWLADENEACLLDAGGFIDIADGKLPRISPGQRVLLTGFSQWLHGRVAVRQPHLESLGGEAAQEPKRIEINQHIQPDEEYRWVEVEGQVEFRTQVQGALDFDLVDNDHRMTVHVLHADGWQKAIPEGARVRVRGLCGGVLDEVGDDVAGVIWAPAVDSVALLSPSNVAGRPPTTPSQAVISAGGTVLTQIDQIRRLSWAELASAPQVKMEGVVTDPLGGSIQDRTGGIHVDLLNDSAWQVAGLGAYVEVEGHAVLNTNRGANGKAPAIEADKIHPLGVGKLPNPLRPSWSVLASGQMDEQWVEVDGVARATDGSHLLLACESGQLLATIRSAPVSAVTNLLDAALRLRGVSLAASDARGQFQGVVLLVPSLSFIQVLQAPADLAVIPARQISALRQIRGPRQLIHRVKVRGVVTGNDDNRYFVQDDSGGALGIAREDVVLSLRTGDYWTFWQTPRLKSTPAAYASLRIGDSVEVVGFPEIRENSLFLTEANFRKTDALKAVSPVKTTTEELSQGGLDSTLVTVEGVVQASESMGRLFILHIQSGLKSFRATLAVNGKQRMDIAPGSRVRVTGVCQMEPESHGEMGRSPSDFSLRLRDAADLSLLELPPWLSLRRALAAVGVLILILLAAFGWIRLLHRQVELKTRQLGQKITEHEQTEMLLAGKTRVLQQEIEERQRVEVEIEKIHKQLLTASRLAGMADVATNVLHNVGNVLNSVNVLTASVASHVKKSRIAGVSKLASLLNEHAADLGRFLTEDASGRSVPSHLERLGARLNDEQSSLLEKITALSESVQHIREIVAMQQNYSKVCGLRETASVAEIVEDALRMCSGALARHEIDLIRDYEEIPPLILDRHKALQILFNLLDNAKLACWESGRADKRIILRILRHGPDRVWIEVSDNGIGITPENLGRIFTQGFSTRKDGHGFGLHSSILAAQDMGGTLNVWSSGPGAGARFTLEIPLTISHAWDEIALSTH